MHVVADDLDHALTRRAATGRHERGDTGETPGNRGSFPAASPHQTPQADQRKTPNGEAEPASDAAPKPPENAGARATA